MAKWQKNGGGGGDGGRQSMEEGKEKGHAAVGDDTGNRMSHVSQFTSPVCNVSDSRQICSHSEGARREGKVIKVSNFKGSVHRLKKHNTNKQKIHNLLCHPACRKHFSNIRGF